MTLLTASSSSSVTDRVRHFAADHLPAALLELPTSVLLALALLVALPPLVWLERRRSRRAHQLAGYPPVLPYSAETLAGPLGPGLIRDGLDKNGGVCAIDHFGKLWYLVDGPKFCDTVYTDSKHFSFEEGALSFLNLGFIEAAGGSKSVIRMANITHNIMAHLEELSPRITDAIDTVIKELRPNDKAVARVPDLGELCSRAISLAMARVMFGELYGDQERKIANHLQHTADAVSQIVGVEKSLHWLSKHLPALEDPWQLVKQGLRVTRHFYLGILPIVYANRQAHLSESPTEGAKGYLPMVSRVLQEAAEGKDDVGFGAIFQATTAHVIGLAFASVHQSAVTAAWVAATLLQHPDMLAKVREELRALIDEQGDAYDDEADSYRVRHSTLARADVLDSFIRETVRARGEIFGAARHVRSSDATIGGYRLPKGAEVHPIISSIYEDASVYAEPTKFDGMRFVGDAKARADAASPSYLPFGYPGRWTCPGRALAVDEIKMVVASLVLRNDVELVGGKFEVLDPTAKLSVAPRAALTLRAPSLGANGANGKKA